MVFYNCSDVVDFVPGQTAGSGQSQWVQPELHDVTVSSDVNVRRLVPFVRIKQEAIRSIAQDFRHYIPVEIALPLRLRGVRAVDDDVLLGQVAAVGRGCSVGQVQADAEVHVLA